MPPGRAGVQEESGISHVGIHRSLLNCVCSQQATVGQPSCFLLRSREEAHPAAAASCTNSSCCPQPWGTRWAEGHSLASLRSHSLRAWPPRRLPTSRQPGSQADAVSARLASALSRGEKETRVEPQGWGGRHGLHAELPALLLRRPICSGGAGKHVLKPPAASHSRPGAFPRAGPAATTAGGSWWRATSPGDPVARGAGWHVGRSPCALLQLRAMCGWMATWLGGGGTRSALVKPRTPPTRVREPGVRPQNHAPAGTPTIS